MAAIVAVAAMLAASATFFGFEFTPQAPGHVGEEVGEENGEEDGAVELGGAILIGLAGGGLAPLTVLLARRRDEEIEGDAAVGLGWSSALPVVLATLSSGAATIHFGVIAQHLDEWWLSGVFFIGVAVFQLLWALLVLLRPSALLYLSGAVVNSLVIATWIVSRTTGVPVGPEAGEVEPVGVPDGLATGYEALLVAVALALLARRPPPLDRSALT